VASTRLICTGCSKRVASETLEDTCGVCGAPLRPMRRFERFVDRWFGPSDTFESEFYHRHRQLVELLWSADGRGQEYYNIMQPGVPYSRFTRRMTDIVCQGILEGWIEVRLPPVPTTDDAAYGVVFKDPDRFAEAVTDAFPSRTAT
jgi:hypothetical protein